MKFGLFYEISVPRPWTRESERTVYQNALEQVRLADELGFDQVWAVLPQLRRQATGPDAGEQAGEGLALGDPQRVVHALKRWEAVGVDRVNFLTNAMEIIPQSDVLASLRLFARAVMPAFADDKPAGGAPAASA